MLNWTFFDLRIPSSFPPWFFGWPNYLNPLMGFLPHGPPFPVPLAIMSSHDDYFCTSPTYDGSGEFTDTRKYPSPGQSCPPATMTGDYPQQEQDQVVNLLVPYEGVDMNSFHYFDGSPNHPSRPNMEGTNHFTHPGLTQPQSTSSHDFCVGTDATLFDYHSLLIDPSFYRPQFNFGHPQYLDRYAAGLAQNPIPPQQPHPAHGAFQLPAQDIFPTQTPHGPLTPMDPSSSWPQHLSAGHGEPVYIPDHPIAGSSMVQGDNASRPNFSAGEHSHSSPVATSSNRWSPSGPSRHSPNPPERDRNQSFPAESPTRRALARRHNHSHSPRRRRSCPEIYGRGPLIPQERYRTSTISSYNAPNHSPFISFNLENPEQIGVPIVDILNKQNDYNRIRDRLETFDMEKKTFTLRIRWPGYSSWSKTIAALDWTKSRSPITRVKLAEAVATGVRDLFERYRDERYDPDYTGWNVGPGGIRLDQVCLVALHQVSKGSWQPELCLLGPPR